MEQPPYPLSSFALLAGIPVPLVQQWWNALLHSQWSEAIALRQTLLGCASATVDGQGAWEHVSRVGGERGFATPAYVLKILNNLMWEGQLTPSQRDVIAEHILHAMTMEGGGLRQEDWRGITHVHGRWKTYEEMARQQAI